MIFARDESHREATRVATALILFEPHQPISAGVGDCVLPLDASIGAANFEIGVTTVAGNIFINYRRGVNLKDAQFLQNVLRRYFASSRVFLDVSGLDGGDHWLHTLERQVDDSVAMVCLLGEGWAELRDEKGNRRLDNPNDFVRFEIARALARNIQVLPVLIDGASMPELSQLPSNLVPLTFPQAMRLRTESFDDDADKIARRLRKLLATARSPRVSPWKAGGFAAAGLAVGIALGPYVLTAMGLPLPWLRIPTETDWQRRYDMADAARKSAESQLLVARQAKVAAEREIQRQGVEVKRLDGLLAEEKERAKTLLIQIGALTAQLKAQEKAVADTRARADQLAKQVEDLKQQIAGVDVACRKLNEDSQGRFKVVGVRSDDTLRIRAQPGKSATEKGGIPHDAVDVEVGACSQGWCLVRHQGVCGFSASGNLRNTNTGLPPVQRVE